MNYIDMFVFVLLIYAIFKGFTRGLIMQLTLLAALLLGILGALKLSGLTARVLEDRFDINPEYIYLVSLGITFVLVFLLVNLLGKLTEKLIEAAELSLLNRLLGILFSVCKTVLIVGVILAYAERIDQRFRFLPKGTKEQSIFFTPFTGIVRTLFPSLGAPGPAEDDSRRELAG
jgi:membrane protein required for colicin V production